MDGQRDRDGKRWRERHGQKVRDRLRTERRLRVLGVFQAGVIEQ